MVIKNISELLPDEPIPPPLDKEIIFNNAVREYTLFGVLALVLVIVSHLLLTRYRRRDVTHAPPTRLRSPALSPAAADDDEATVDTIAMSVCTLSLSISLGAVLLLPISIVSNEILATYRDSLYVRWINRSLIQGLWNMVFLFSNLVLFVALPFAYLFTEAEGFPGSKKGVRARMLETVVVLLLLVVLVLGVAFILALLLGYCQHQTLMQIIDVWSSFYLPFLYSLISCLGVLFLLLCTPVGLGRLFSTLKGLIRGGPRSTNNTDYKIPSITTSSKKRSKFSSIGLPNSKTPSKFTSMGSSPKNSGSKTSKGNKTKNSSGVLGVEDYGVAEDLNAVTMHEQALARQLHMCGIDPMEEVYHQKQQNYHPKNSNSHARQRRNSNRKYTRRLHSMDPCINLHYDRLNNYKSIGTDNNDHFNSSTMASNNLSRNANSLRLGRSNNFSITDTIDNNSNNSGGCFGGDNGLLPSTSITTTKTGKRNNNDNNNNGGGGSLFSAMPMTRREKSDNCSLLSTTEDGIINDGYYVDPSVLRSDGIFDVDHELTTLSSNSTLMNLTSNVTFNSTTQVAQSNHSSFLNFTNTLSSVFSTKPSSSSSSNNHSSSSCVPPLSSTSTSSKSLFQHHHSELQSQLLNKNGGGHKSKALSLFSSSQSVRDNDENTQQCTQAFANCSDICENPAQSLDSLRNDGKISAQPLRNDGASVTASLFRRRSSPEARLESMYSATETFASWSVSISTTLSSSISYLKSSILASSSGGGAVRNQNWAKTKSDVPKSGENTESNVFGITKLNQEIWPMSESNVFGTMNRNRNDKPEPNQKCSNLSPPIGFPRLPKVFSSKPSPDLSITEKAARGNAHNSDLYGSELQSESGTDLLTELSGGEECLERPRQFSWPSRMSMTAILNADAGCLMYDKGDSNGGSYAMEENSRGNYGGISSISEKYYSSINGNSGSNKKMGGSGGMTRSVSVLSSTSGSMWHQSEEKWQQHRSDLLMRWQAAYQARIRLEHASQHGLLRRCLIYPLGVLFLGAVTALVVVLVVFNTLQLISGFKSLPLVVVAVTSPGGNSASEDEDVLIPSFEEAGAMIGKRAVLVWILGPLGAVVEVALILYLVAASLVGCYSLPLMKKVKPVYGDTPMVHLIINCMLLLVLASALPLLATILGLTNFDLLGDYGRVGWLGNLWIVLGYNLLFASAAVWCLVHQFTAAVRGEIMDRLSVLCEAILRKFRSSNNNTTAVVDYAIIDSNNYNSNNIVGGIVAVARRSLQRILLVMNSGQVGVGIKRE
uniref:Protein LMBR1L n=1 Tax=Hirondellea gigas TaxID=1518452 RepID=A0A2P2I659_9CRUS